MIETHGKTGKGWSKRPHFSARQKLSAHQLNSALDDQLSRSALLMRALHGSGVVFGLEARVADGGKALSVNCGMALDRHGRILFWQGGEMPIHDLVGPPLQAEGCYTLFIHYAERHAGGGGCGPCETEPDWIEQGVVFSLKPDCRDACHGCPDIPDDCCISYDDYVCLRTGAHEGAVPPSPDLATACEVPGALCAAECGWSYDIAAGLPLACLEVCDLRPKDADCPPRLGFCDKTPDNCDVRAFVYRTPLLQELIRNCHLDLPMIKSLSWRDWIDRDWDFEVEWSEFKKRFESGYDGFEIEFTKPIQVRTLNPGSVFLTAYTWETASDYWLPKIIPADIVPVDPADGLTRRIRLEIFKDWIEAEIEGARSTLFSGSNIEFTIRGQTLRDACGNMLDARLLGYSPIKQGQDRPGGDFVAMFRHAANPEERRGRARGSQARAPAPPAEAYANDIPTE